MAGYTKLFGTILDSTIWREDNNTRILWITMLAMVDKNGIVEAAVPGLADRARIKIQDCRKSLAKLSGPDRDSRTRDFGGRRIKAIDGGWEILNHKKYRDRLSVEERKEYLRVKQAEHRAKVKMSTPVNNVKDKYTESTHTDTDTSSDTDSTSKAEESTVCVGPSFSDWMDECEKQEFPADEAESAFHHYQANGWVQTSGRKIKEWRSAVITCRERWIKQQGVAS